MVVVVVVFAAGTGVGESEHVSEHGRRFRQDDSINAEVEVIYGSEDSVCICVVKRRSIIAPLASAHGVMAYW